MSWGSASAQGVENSLLNSLLSPSLLQSPPQLRKGSIASENARTFLLKAEDDEQRRVLLDVLKAAVYAANKQVKNRLVQVKSHYTD